MHVSNSFPGVHSVAQWDNRHKHNFSQNVCCNSVKKHYSNIIKTRKWNGIHSIVKVVKGSASVVSSESPNRKFWSHTSKNCICMQGKAIIPIQTLHDFSEKMFQFNFSVEKRYSAWWSEPVHSPARFQTGKAIKQFTN